MSFTWKLYDTFLDRPQICSQLFDLAAFFEHVNDLADILSGAFAAYEQRTVRIYYDKVVHTDGGDEFFRAVYQ